MIFKYVELIFDVFKLIWEQFTKKLQGTNIYINGIFVKKMAFHSSAKDKAWVSNVATVSERRRNMCNHMGWVFSHSVCGSVKLRS